SARCKVLSPNPPDRAGARDVRSIATGKEDPTARVSQSHAIRATRPGGRSYSPLKFPEKSSARNHPPPASLREPKKPWHTRRCRRLKQGSRRSRHEPTRLPCQLVRAPSSGAEHGFPSLRSKGQSTSSKARSSQSHHWSAR